jgi:hypothetical protein
MTIKQSSNNVGGLLIPKPLKYMLRCKSPTAFKYSMRADACPCLSLLHTLRYSDDAIDLCDVLSSYSSQAKVSLHELCKVMELPGKPNGISGADVDRYYREDRGGEARDDQKCGAWTFTAAPGNTPDISFLRASRKGGARQEVPSGKTSGNARWTRYSRSSGTLLGVLPAMKQSFGRGKLRRRCRQSGMCWV